MTTYKDRAARRQAEWTDEVVEPKTTKGLLYASLSPKERFIAFTELNQRVWGIDGLRTKEPRENWPGEIFELHNARED